MVLIAGENDLLHTSCCFCCFHSLLWNLQLWRISCLVHWSTWLSLPWGLCVVPNPDWFSDFYFDTYHMGSVGLQYNHLLCLGCLLDHPAPLENGAGPCLVISLWFFLLCSIENLFTSIAGEATIYLLVNRRWFINRLYLNDYKCLPPAFQNAKKVLEMS